MKAIAIVKYVFALVGFGLLAGAVLAYTSTNTFLQEAAKAEGTVVDLERSRSSDSITYRLVVQFVGRNGQEIEFTTSTGSNPPSYSKGQKVEILYHPEEPGNAKINGFFSLWGLPLILGGMGGVFFSIAAGIVITGTLKSHKDDYLRKHGSPIETQFQGVELNTSFAVNGRHPFRILTQWQNPVTSEVHVFKSDNLWFDPTVFIKNDQITVFLDRDDPRSYHVDLSFLPKLAK